MIRWWWRKLVCCLMFIFVPHALRIGTTARTVSSSTRNRVTSLSCGAKQCRKTLWEVSRKDRGSYDDRRWVTHHYQHHGIHWHKMNIRHPWFWDLSEFAALEFRKTDWETATVKIAVLLVKKWRLHQVVNNGYALYVFGFVWKVSCFLKHHSQGLPPEGGDQAVHCLNARRTLNFSIAYSLGAHSIQFSVECVQICDIRFRKLWVRLLLTNMLVFGCAAVTLGLVVLGAQALLIS